MTKRLKKVVGKLRDRAEDVVSFVIHPTETLESLENKRKKDQRNGL